MEAPEECVFVVNVIILMAAITIIVIVATSITVASEIIALVAIITILSTAVITIVTLSSSNSRPSSHYRLRVEMVRRVVSKVNTPSAQASCSYEPALVNYQKNFCAAQATTPYRVHRINEGFLSYVVVRNLSKLWWAPFGAMCVQFKLCAGSPQRSLQLKYPKDIKSDQITRPSFGTSYKVAVPRLRLFSNLIDGCDITCARNQGWCLPVQRLMFMSQ